MVEGNSGVPADVLIGAAVAVALVYRRLRWVRHRVGDRLLSDAMPIPPLHLLLAVRGPPGDLLGRRDRRLVRFGIRSRVTLAGPVEPEIGGRWRAEDAGAYGGRQGAGRVISDPQAGEGA